MLITQVSFYKYLDRVIRCLKDTCLDADYSTVPLYKHSDMTQMFLGYVSRCSLSTTAPPHASDGIRVCVE